MSTTPTIQDQQQKGSDDSNAPYQYQFISWIQNSKGEC